MVKRRVSTQTVSNLAFDSDWEWLEVDLKRVSYLTVFGVNCLIYVFIFILRTRFPFHKSIASYCPFHKRWKSPVVAVKIKFVGELSSEVRDVLRLTMKTKFHHGLARPECRLRFRITVDVNAEELDVVRPLAAFRFRSQTPAQQNKRDYVLKQNMNAPHRIPWGHSNVLSRKSKVYYFSISLPDLWSPMPFHQGLCIKILILPLLMCLYSCLEDCGCCILLRALIHAIHWPLFFKI